MFMCLFLFLETLQFVCSRCTREMDGIAAKLAKTLKSFQACLDTPLLIRNAPSTAGNSMTGSERPSPEPLLEKEASPAALGVREFWKCSGRKSLRSLQPPITQNISWGIIIIT